jgi:hypothetical protein
LRKCCSSGGLGETDGERPTALLLLLLLLRTIDCTIKQQHNCGLFFSSGQLQRPFNNL